MATGKKGCTRYVHRREPLLVVGAPAVPRVRGQGTQTKRNGQASRQISSGQLNASRRLHTRPIKVVVFDPPTAWMNQGGNPILESAWLLDAFRAYPFRT